jgi:hypothetical protein
MRNEGLEAGENCSEKLHSLYSSANIVRVIKSGRIRWVGHVARMVKIRNA